MDSVLDILDALESPARGGSPGTAVVLARGLGVCSTPGCRAVLGEPLGTAERPPALTPGQWQLLTELLRHDPATPELGAVLVPDGSTVALGPLLAGIEAGLRSGGSGPPLPTLDPPADPLLAVTIAEALGTSFLLAQGGDSNATALGPGGCWDDVENPLNYTSRGPPSPVPDPVAIGAMDGVILGTQLAQGPLPVAELLRGYYGVGNGSEAGRAPSSYRRRDFGALAGQERLEKEVAAVLEVLRTLSPSPELLRDMGTQEVVAVARQAAQEFTERYVGTGGVAPPKWGWHFPNRGRDLPDRGFHPLNKDCNRTNGRCHPLEGIVTSQIQIVTA
ncbi:N-acetylmuramoyl-L-alanine amidase-like protein [Turdus rufiventris]|nr:N-acetylmuramoyl-L-alanine amidase-like protein [Turdus rufiventris]